jgi:1,4-alpha-glucan branching enzyme
MGNEFGHPEWIDFPREGNGWSYHYARRLWSLENNENLRYRFLSVFDKEMLALVNKRPEFFYHSARLVFSNEGDQVLVYERNGLLFVFNFNPVKSFTDYRFEYQKGKFRVCLNTDSDLFGGHARIDESVVHITIKPDKSYYSPQVLSLYLPSQTGMVLQSC